MIPIQNAFIGAAASSNPEGFLRAGSKVFFRADDGAHGVEPWVTDGTAAGTKVLDIFPGSGGSYPLTASFGGQVVFTVYEGHGYALWRSDGSAGGTIKLLTLPVPNPNASYGYTTVGADTRAFLLLWAGYGLPTEIYVTDGSVAGTKDLGAFPINADPAPIGANGNLYFVGQDASVGPQLWVSDGTTEGTHLVRRDVECPGASCGPTPRSFFKIGAQTLFLTSDGLWKTDGTGAGTQMLASITDPALYASSPTSPFAYLSAPSGALWKTDGTAAGTQQTGTVPQSAYSTLMLDDGTLVSLRNLTTIRELWKSDGTDAGSSKVGTFPTPAPTGPGFVGAMDVNRVLLQASTFAAGRELWMADLSTGSISLLKDIDSRVSSLGPSSGTPLPGIALGSHFLFPATDVAGRELWMTDGTTAGTSMLANIAPDPGGGVVSGTVRTASTGTAIFNVRVALCAPSITGSCDTAVTDANGYYHFDGVIPGTYIVSASSFNYLLQRYEGVDCPCPSGSGTPVVVSSGLETAGIDFSLIRGGTFAGTITRASNGQPIGGVQVAIRNSTGAVVDTESTDNHGNYRSRGLITGSYYAETDAAYSYDDHPSADQVYHNHDCSREECDWHIGEAISVTTGIDITGIDFSLHEYGTIAGTVRDDTGAAVSGLGVSFLRQGGQFSSASSVTDASGHYLSPLLNPGSYYVVTGGYRGFNVTVYPNGSCYATYNCTPTGGTLVPVAIDGATTGIDVQLTASASRLVGTIRARDGAPLSGINVQIRNSNGYYISVDGGPTDANGHYELNNVLPGTYYLFALDELYPGVDCFSNGCSVAGATPLVLTNGHTTHADMQLHSQKTTISGHLLDAVTGQPISGNNVYFVPTESYGVSPTWGPGGSYQVTIVSRQTAFYLVGTASGYHTTMYPSARWECAAPCSPPAGAISISAGTSTNIDILMERTGSVSGTITDADTGAPIGNIPVYFGSTVSGGTSVNATTDATGHYKAYLLAGQYNALAVPYQANTYLSQVFHDRNCAGTCNPSTGEIINVADGVDTPGIDFHLSPTNTFGTISGHVLDAETNLPMANVYVHVNNQMSASTDAQGFYSISHSADSGSGLRTGQYTLYAQAPQPYWIGLSGGGNCADFPACVSTGTPVTVTAPNTTTVDFRMVKLRITSVSPAYGPVAGGTYITITGTNFTPVATVTIGTNAATVVSTTPAQIVAVTPASITIGAAHVTVRVSYVAVTYTQSFMYLPAAAFSDEPLVARVTVMKAAHILELRAAVNRLRVAALLPGFPFTDPAISGGFVKAVHIAELRTALNQARAALGLPALSYTYAIASGAAIHAIDIAEIRNGVR
jgi:ELWxxDGT repeat protein